MNQKIMTEISTALFARYVHYKEIKGLLLFGLVWFWCLFGLFFQKAILECQQFLNTGGGNICTHYPTPGIFLYVKILIV